MDEESEDLKIFGFAKTFGAKQVDIEGGVVVCEFEGRQALDHFVSALEDLEYVESYEIRIEGDDGDVSSFETLPSDIRALVIVYIAGDFVSYGYYEDEEEYADDGADDAAVAAGEGQSAAELSEVVRKIKVNFRGRKRVKMQCRPGFKWNPTARVCQKIEGAELAKNRKSHRRAILTKRSMGSAFKKRVIRKSAKARRYRSALGLK